MEILSEKSFKTRNHVKVTCRVDDNGEAYLRFDGLYSVKSGTARYGEDYPVFFYREEREAMQTLLAGGKLEVKPKFHKGDIVRFYPEKDRSELGRTGYSAQQDALAVVTRDYDGSETYVQVKWICTRGKSQNNGGYPPECFEIVSKSQLSDLDHRAILNRVLDKSI